MELELGLKITKVLEDFASAELLIAKDQAGPLFLSRETNTMFVLNVHLKGFKRENIKIEINEDGTRITISGEKPVKEMVMMGWKVIKNKIENRGFRKAFKIPNGVDLDKIKGKFDEEESYLTISMPKLVKGVMVGAEIEEVKEDEVAGGGSETMQIVPNGDADKEKTLQQGAGEREEDPDETQGKENHDLEEKLKKEGQERESTKPKTGLEENNHGTDSVKSIVEERTSDETPRAEGKVQGGIEEVREPKGGQELHQTKTSLLKQPTDKDQHDKDQEVHGKEEIQEGNEVVELPKQARDIESSGMKREKNISDGSPQSENPPTKSSKLSAPVVAGSAFVVSLIVLAFHLFRNQNKSSNIRAKKQ
ncbi:hypothetical protein F0562_002690 [Nyssa sinensis]|uniref:SHSP domain-containing protein n=1 Tax=Nyssa sinensis TaxID=561372 RepID=A0A5J5BZ62_9ASTE|nr:hypothetical protein F0562_002690 [Nyssa sinensis]